MKRSFKKPIYIVAAKRTAFGSYLGSLATFSATDLGVHASKSALSSISLSPKLIDHVIFGNVLQTSKDAIYLARHVGLRCEIPHTTPALTVNRLCGSGFEALIQGARLLNSNEAQCVLVGGSESMSQAPHIIRGARRGLALSQGALEDSLWESLHDSFINTTMAVTAENLAAKYKISQEEVDNFCLKSQQNYQQACARGVFTDEIAPISCKITKNTMLLDYDEHPRPDTSLAALQKLPKIFKAEGVIHAAAASGICDGAAALLMCTESFAHEHALKPLAELISFGMSGCDPNLMGIGPVSAIKICLERAELNLDHITMIEINEAFAPQVLAVLKELEIRRDINIHGGALAIGHPLAASGARISAHLAHSLKDQPHALGVGAACIGGGQGIAVLLRSLGA